MAYILKTKKTLIYFFLISAVIILSLIFLAKPDKVNYKNNSFQDGEIVSIEIRDNDDNLKKELEVELSTSSWSHYQGLSNRDSLENIDGMLFIFNNKSNKTFVMRNMNFSLDIIFIADNRILNILKNLKF